MNNYEMIGLDLDGTLLRDDQTISPEDLAAINQALAVGKTVVISTGRAITEVKPYFDELAGIKWICAECGAILFNKKEQSIVSRHTLSNKAMEMVFNIIDKEDIMVQALYHGQSIMNHDMQQQMPSHQMGKYISLYRKASFLVPDILVFIQEHFADLEKINLYHVSREASIRTFNRLDGIDAERTFAEESSLEISPKNITKGTGLKDLADFLHINMSQVIAVGDSPNDIPALKMAGLGVAMKNSTDEIKKYANVITLDNNHFGCANVIKKYLI